MRDFRGHTPLFWGGILVGLVEAVFYLANGEPINLASAPGELIAYLEDLTPSGSIFESVFIASPNPVFLGVILGAAGIAFLEAGRRARARYPSRVLISAFFGGFLFGLGANLSGGDLFYHAVGGMALMQISSLFIVALSIPFTFLAMEIMSVLNINPYFQLDQELRGETAMRALTPGALKQRNNSYAIRGAMALFLTGLAALMLRGSDYSLLNLLLGIVLGIGMAKTGFAVEWGMLVPDVRTFSARYMEQLGVDAEASATLRSFSPLHAWLSAVLILSVTAFGVWFTRGQSGSPPSGMLAAGLNLGHVAAGPLLAIGSMLMLGSDVRTYARLGLGYATALAALPGLLLGYLPSALFSEEISSWLDSNLISSEEWVPQIFSDSVWVGILLWLGFIISLGGFLYMTISDRKPGRPISEEPSGV